MNQARSVPTSVVRECGALTSYGDIWLVESQDRTTALVIVASKEAPDSELRDCGRGQLHRLTPVKASPFPAGH